MFWKHPVLLHSKEPINSPLTTLPSEDLQHKAVELFKMVHQFMSSLIESHTLELHVHMAQTVIQRCILDPPLQNELFCHLIKQTSRHPIQTRSTVQVRYRMNFFVILSNRHRDIRYRQDQLYRYVTEWTILSSYQTDIETSDTDKINCTGTLIKMV